MVSTYHPYWMIKHPYLNEKLLPLENFATSKKMEAHSLFWVTVANDGQLLIKMSIQLEINFASTEGGIPHSRGSKSIPE